MVWSDPEGCSGSRNVGAGLWTRIHQPPGHIKVNEKKDKLEATKTRQVYVRPRKLTLNSELVSSRSSSCLLGRRFLEVSTR